MTVTSFLNYKEYQGDGVATTFAIPFLLLNRDDLKVYIDSKLVLGGYTLTEIGNPISSIIFTEAPKGKVLLQRNIDLLRDTDYQENGDLLADTLNRDFDRVYLALQGVAQNTSQSLRVIDPEGINTLPLKDTRANKLLYFDNQGQPQLTAIENSSALELASALSNTNDKQKGAALVGFNDDLTYPEKTIGHALKNTVPLFTTQWWADRKSIPDGYVAADGQELSRLVYPDVVNALQSGQMPQTTNDIWLSDSTKRGCYVVDTGNGTFRLPDYNGMQSSSIGALFFRGGNYSVAEGTIQTDAIRNIQGNMTVYRWTGNATAQQAVSGVFLETKLNNATLSSGVTANTALSQIVLDASSVVPTAEENRPINVTGCWIIRLYGKLINKSELDASKIALAYSDLSTRVSVLEKDRFIILYPNSGTAEKPAAVTTTNRYILDNPFKGHLVECRAEILIDNLWGIGEYYHFMNGTAASSRGTVAHQLVSVDGNTDQIIIQTGTMGVTGHSQNSGSPHGINVSITTAPCRVLVWRID